MEVVQGAGGLCVEGGIRGSVVERWWRRIGGLILPSTVDQLPVCCASVVIIPFTRPLWLEMGDAVADGGRLCVGELSVLRPGILALSIY